MIYRADDINIPEEPTVSVVIPCYNAESYIGIAIESVLSQTFRARELIVIDDGSTDRTLGVVEGYISAGVRHFSQVNKGPGAARSLGLEYARGEYVAFLDADDLWYPDKLQAQVAYFIGNPSSVAVGTLCRYVNRFGRVYGSMPINTDVNQEALRMAIAMPFPLSSCLFRTASLRKIGGWDVGLQTAQDLDLMARVAEVGQVGVVGEVLSLYRVHESGISGERGYDQFRNAAFIRARQAARLEGGHLTRHDFMATDQPSNREVRQWKASRRLRSTRVALMEKSYVRLLGHLTCAFVLAPGLVAARVFNRSRLFSARVMSKRTD